MGALYAILTFALVMGGFVVLSRRIRSGRVGPGAMGTAYDLLHEDKRKAVEIIISQRAGASDPETADDDPPDLWRPKS